MSECRELGRLCQLDVELQANNNLFMRLKHGWDFARAVEQRIMKRGRGGCNGTFMRHQMPRGIILTQKSQNRG